MKTLGILLTVLCIYSVDSTFYHSPGIHHSPIYLPPPQPYPLYVIIPKQVNGPCFDVHGRFVPFGRMYFDGIYWRICGQNNKVKPGYGILAQKWQMVFRMLDVNRDKQMSEADGKHMIDLFAKYFGLKGKQIEPVRRSISLVWKLLLMNKPSHMTVKDFVQQMWSSYTLRRKMLFATIMKITDLLLFVTDNNKDALISFPEWKVLMQILGIQDQRAAHFLFKFTVPNFWGYSTILGARQFIMNLILDQDPHYFFKYSSILQSAGLMSARPPVVKNNGGNGSNGNNRNNGNNRKVVAP